MRVLLAEDEPRIAQAIQRGLEQEKIFAVDCAATGSEAVDMALSEPYDIIILDVLLPGIDGFTVCRTIRAERITTPVLILSAKDQVQDKVTGLEAGADDYLAKPFAFSELVARVKALLRRPPLSSQDTLSYNDLELNSTALTVTRAGTSIQLSAREFAVLDFFLRNQGKILKKEQILAHAWEYDSDVLLNTVEATIKNVRKKIEQPFPELPTVIQTVRGYGYKLEST